MMPHIREAVYISQDFGTTTFVGATAVMLHTGEQRRSQDLDFIVAEQITDDVFLDKGYKINLQGDKFTPRGYKIDVYHERDLNGIPLDYIMNTAAIITVDRGKNHPPCHFSGKVDCCKVSNRVRSGY